MKKQFTIILLSLACVAMACTKSNAQSESLKTGRWNINGALIERQDSIELHHKDCETDTLRLTWLNAKTYKVYNPRNGWTMTIRVDKIRDWGYAGVAYQNGRKAFFEAITIEKE